MQFSSLRHDRAQVRGDLFERTPAWAALAMIGTLFMAVYALRSLDRSVNEDVLLLFVIPTVLAALRFGAIGGLVAASLGTGLMLTWDLSRADVALSAWAYLARAFVFFPVGVLLGRFVSSRRSLLRRISRGEEISLDMIATVGSDGYFKSVNPAWTRTLGHSEEQLLSAPYVDLVHPEDREVTVQEAAAVGSGERAVNFRNRYRALDGSYRWLEWNACRSAEDGLIYAVARDVTVQQQAEEFVSHQAEQLELAVKERTVALQAARLENLTRLGLAAEYRDDDTHYHTERVGRYAELIARELDLDEHFVWKIRLAAPLHDVGKIGIPDDILLKPGKLTDEEFERMKTHTTVGAAILGGSHSELLQMGEEIALSHHERWDGSGYPAQIAGEEIPLAGRIVAVADAFDAMTNSRPYKKASPVVQAIAELERCSGTQFDPQAVRALIQALAGDPIAVNADLQQAKPARDPRGRARIGGSHTPGRDETHHHRVPQKTPRSSA